MVEDPTEVAIGDNSSLGSSSTTTQNVTTISETAVPPETQIPGENSNPTQIATQTESDGSDTEHFSDAISNRGEEPRSNNVGATPTTDQNESTNNATTKNDNATEVAQKPDLLGATNDKEIRL